tara:strand:+ start:2776 stop:4857 length:2082 start_codon:yes stop_codon:yes gene_type:complete
MGSISKKLSDILDSKGFVKGTNKYIGGVVTSKSGLVSAQAQPKSKVGQDSQILDESLDNFKKPNSDLDVSQKIASTGETVPIVFGKRANNIGGIWMQPSLIKAGTASFVQKLLFVISQGEIVSTPIKSKAFTGLLKLPFLNDSTVSLSHIYSTAESLAASPNSCPISGTGLFCGNDIYTYLNPLIKPVSGSYLENVPDFGKDFANFRIKTFGTGDTSNTTFVCTLQVFDAETGDNVTTAWQTYLNVQDMEFGFNQRFSSNGTLLGGKTVGTIEDTISQLGGQLIPPINSATVADGTYTQSNLNSLNAVSNGRTKFIFKNTFLSVNNQIIPSNPASTGTLEGVQFEETVGTSAVIQNTSNNNSSFADITFLATSGNLFEGTASGTFPSITKQLYIFYEQGVKVDLFSAGLSGSSYTQGASNQFIDLAMHLFKLYKKIDGNNTASIVAPVELSNLQSLCTFCTNNSMFFNGIISKAVNIVDFITETAPFYFLSFLSVGGKYQFSPILPITVSNQIDTTAITPTMTFTEANIIQGSFQKGYLSVEERREFVASCIYTECIPTEVARRKTVSVRFSSSALDSPTEQFDMSDFCADVNHAILYAKYELARRKHSTHVISFSTPLLTTTLIPTNIIKLQLQRKNSVGDDRQEIEYYQVSSITYDNDGVSNIEAAHFPLDSNDKSEISLELTTGTFTVLQ